MVWAERESERKEGRGVELEGEDEIGKEALAQVGKVRRGRTPAGVGDRWMDGRDGEKDGSVDNWKGGPKGGRKRGPGNGRLSYNEQKKREKSKRVPLQKDRWAGCCCWCLY